MGDKTQIEGRLTPFSLPTIIAIDDIYYIAFMQQNTNICSVT